MAPHSIITESDNMSRTLTNPSSSGSPSSLSQESTQTSVTGTPLLGIRPPPSFSSQSNQSSNEDELDGWSRLANVMAKTPDFESFSRFRELNVKNLLYYQVELTQLRDQLRDWEKRDLRKRGLPGAAKHYSKSAIKLINSQDPDNQQLILVKKIRKLLKQYNAALIQHAQVSALPEPEDLNVESLRVWLMRPEYGNYCILGKGSDAWGNLYEAEKDPPPLSERIQRLFCSIFWTQKPPPNKLDLVATRPRRKVDGLTRWVKNEWIPFYHWWKNPKAPGPNDEEKRPSRAKEKKDQENKDEDNNLEKYSENTVLKFTSAVATVVACILPTLAIGILTTAHGRAHTLLYIGGFTALFAIGLMFLTNAETSRVEIFTATAAFSAVLVVFVQNQ